MQSGLTKISGHEVLLLLKDASQDNDIDGRVKKAISLIKEKHGTNKIEDLAHFVNVSERRLQQLFAEYIGISPKRVASIYRIHKVVYDLLKDNCQTSIYAYHYDQAHFINDFKKHSGMSFSQFRESVFTSGQGKKILQFNLYID